MRHQSIDLANSQYSQNSNSLTNSYLHKKRFSTQPKQDVLKIFQKDIEDLLGKASIKKLKRKQEQQKMKTLPNQLQVSKIKNQVQQIKGKIELVKQARKIENKINQIVTQLAIKNATQQTKKNGTTLPQISLPTSRNLLPYMPHHSPHYLPHYPQHFPRPRRYNPMDTIYDQIDEDNLSRVRQNLRNQKSKFANKRQKQFDRHLRRQKNRKKLKKVFHAVSFIIILKNFSKKIMKKRKQIFDLFWPNKFSFEANKIKRYFTLSQKQFFVLLLQKQNINLSIQINESKKIKKQKFITIKKILKIFIKGIKNGIQFHSFNKIIPIIHIFCKHGAYLSNGILTPQQIQTVCISQNYGYLRSNSSIEKAQIINFLYIKIILFNMVLQPWKIDEVNFNTQKDSLMENCYFLGSLIYYLFLQIQDEYLGRQHGPNYKINNWSNQQDKFKIQCCPPLIYLNSQYEPGQHISGLIDQQTINSIFPKQIWNEQKQQIKRQIEKIHKMLRQYHHKLKQQILSYKKQVNLPYRPL